MAPFHAAAVAHFSILLFPSLVLIFSQLHLSTKMSTTNGYNTRSKGPPKLDDVAPGRLVCTRPTDGVSCLNFTYLIPLLML